MAWTWRRQSRAKQEGASRRERRVRAGAEQEGALSGNGANLKDAQAYPPARSTGGHYCSTTMVSRAGRRAPARFLLLLVWLDDNGECEQEGASSGNDAHLKDAQAYPPARSSSSSLCSSRLLTAPAPAAVTWRRRWRRRSGLDLAAQRGLELAVVELCCHDRQRRQKRRAGTFLSGGKDSWTKLKKNKN